MQTFLTAGDSEVLSALRYRRRRFPLSQSIWDIGTISQNDWALVSGESDWKGEKAKEGFYKGDMAHAKASFQ